MSTATPLFPSDDWTAGGESVTARVRPISVADAFRLAPQLVDIERFARTCDPDDERGWRVVGFKLRQVVGFGARDPRLSDSKTYELVADHMRMAFEESNG